ncbi:Bcr/CflA family efflux MFS transporter [Schauerella aestuarii]|uniref:Bcr/CflA family efflux MFS transporter n=1 Tax=Schauerella aestuarii TaxID=2511204 RepID=UPI001370F000|nr:Bcr/CflA family efflux MFS transporter [Achromobacter aestuarii]
MSASPSSFSRLAHVPPYRTMIAILGVLACIGPLSIDAYLPAFGAIGQEFGLPQEAVQRTLGYYMVAYAVMTLLHGTLSDSFGRRPVVIVSLLVYIAGSVLATFAPSFDWLLVGRVLQGLSAGAGMVVGQAVVNDCYEGPVARRTLSYIIMVFSVSPAIAPILGGYLSTSLGWRSVFVLLAALALAACVLCYRRLPETLAPPRRQPFSVRALATNYMTIARDGVFMAFALAFGVLFAGFAFLIGAAHDFVTHVLGLPDTAFGWLFIPLVVGLTTGSFAAARLSSRWSPGRMIGMAYLVMVLSCVANMTYAAVAEPVQLPWAVLPLAFFNFGLAIAIPNMTLQVLTRQPKLSGMAASVLGFVQMVFFSAVSGWMAPWVYGSAFRLALALGLGVAASGLLWFFISQLASRRDCAPREALEAVPPVPVTHVFIYGTLRRGEINDLALVAKGRSLPEPVWVGASDVAGALIDFGDWPGLLADVPDRRVRGEVYRIDPRLLPVLDEIEEYDAARRTVFVRQEVDVLVAGQPVRCWYYPVDPELAAAARPVAGDDWIDHRKAR